MSANGPLPFVGHLPYVALIPCALSPQACNYSRREGMKARKWSSFLTNKQRSHGWVFTRFHPNLRITHRDRLLSVRKYGFDHVRITVDPIKGPQAAPALPQCPQ